MGTIVNLIQSLGIEVFGWPIDVGISKSIKSKYEINMEGFDVGGRGSYQRCDKGAITKIGS
jgi:hypothetical protein